MASTVWKRACTIHQAALWGFDVTGGAASGQSDVSLTVKPGDTMQLRLVWQAMEPTQTSYTAFVHLLAPDGAVANQDDSVPGRGTLPTTSWVRGEVLQDTYTLTVPANAVSGLYQVEFGLYDAVTGSRLRIWDSSGASVGDSLILTKVSVEQTP